MSPEFQSIRLAGQPQISCRQIALACGNACGRAWATGVTRVKREAAREAAAEVGRGCPERWRPLFTRTFVAAALKTRYKNVGCP